MKTFMILLVHIVPICAFTQVDSAFILKIKALDTADVLRFDTVNVPNDAHTQKIIQLRNERNGFGIEKVIQIKLAEEQQKDKQHGKEFYTKLSEELSNGTTGKLLNNYLVNLYRKTYTEEEIDDLIRFYKTSAGKKMDESYLLLLVQSVKGAEALLKLAAGRLQ
jgi:hypothetical protein